MDEITILEIVGYVLNVGVVALAVWLLKVRDRLLILESNHAHLQEKVDGSEGEISQLNETLHDLAKQVGELVVELRSKGTINGRG